MLECNCNAVFQAPESMKSVVQAAWLLTTAVGDVVVVVVAGVKLFSQVAVSCALIIDPNTCQFCA